MIISRKMWLLGVMVVFSGIMTSSFAADVYRVTTISPFPRGLELIDGDLYVLSRGRVRGAGGVSAEIADRAGTLFKVDPAVGQLVSESNVSEAVQENGEVFCAAH